MSKSEEKSSWPEAVGKPWQEAQTKILNEFPKISIQVLPENSMVTMDYRTDRVRIFTNAEGKVTQTPCIG